jgi:hypothetical protein
MSAQLHVSPLPSDRTLSETRIEELLRQGHTIGIHIEDGRQIGVHFDGAWYRSGVLRAKSLASLKALALSAIR